MEKPHHIKIWILLLSFVLLFWSTSAAQTIAINEVMASNTNSIADEDGDNSDWIEIYNYGSNPMSLAGYGLSDNSNLPFKWVFPSVGIQPGQFILVWASGKNRTTPGKPLHTNFSISAAGEELILTKPDGTIIDQLPPTSIPTGYSYGRLPNGTGNWFYYTQVTPGASNSSTTTFHPPDPPVFSHPSGFYADGFTLTLSHADNNATIVYTTDGSEPKITNLSGVSYKYKNQYPQNPGQPTGPLLTNTYTSVAYTQPVYISDRSPEPNKLASISSTWHYAPDYLPTNPIKKATVVRAAAIVNGVSSRVITNTYFVSEASAFAGDLPIASIAVNEDDLFDYNKGIYVAGIDFDNWRKNNPNGITNGHVQANYRRRGIETEKPASFQYFVNEKEVINQNIGLRLHGSFSRHVQNKTFRLYARSEYDAKNSFDYPFFGSGNSGSFKRLLLRNSGNDAGNYWIGGAFQWTYSPAVYFRDAFIHKMVSHLGFDIMDYMPVITYVNGEYWGLLNLRERYDQHYLERKYGIAEAELDYLTGNASAKIGINAHYLMTRNFIENNNLAITDNYNHVKTLIDTDNFMNYHIAQIYARNTDWPGNNIDYFRKRTDQFTPDAPYGQDGRWRWMMFDTDHGFGWSGANSFTHNTLQGASTGTGWSTIILSKLLENTSFRNDFINRYADLLNSAFLPERLVGMINEMAGRIADEIPLHRERWNTLHNWEAHVEHMCEFAEKRPENARNHIRSRFNISSNLTATLDVSNSEHGYIKINTIEIAENTPGISVNPWPWTGIYFRSIPLKIAAIPKPGYQFSHWSGASNSNEAALIINPTGNFSLKANFIPIPESEYELLYFWLMDNHLENDTPLQTIQSTFSANGSPATISFHSSMGAGYPFESGHPDWRKGSMERRNAPTPVNYYPKANNNLAYGNFEMRGIQLKQPFLSNGFENTLIIDFSTENYRNIMLSFAAKDEGAANSLVIDYFNKDSQQWMQTGIVVSDAVLTGNYKQFDVNLSQMTLADNNPDFKLRIRFAGTDMTKDDGNRVTFNNIAIRGTQFIFNNINPELDEKPGFISAYPNPFHSLISIQIDQAFTGSEFKLYNLNGQLIHSGILKDEISLLDLAHIGPGVYVLKVFDGNANVQFIKLVKQQL